MARTKVDEYSVTASANTDIDGTNIGEGSLAKDLNNALRTLMSHIAATPLRETAADMRAALDVSSDAEIGSGYQPLDANLTSLSALGTAADKISYTTGVDTWAETAITSFGRSIIDDADAAAVRTTISAQTLDATLTSISALGTAADKIAYTTGIDTWAEASITTAGRALIDDASADAQLATLGGSTGGIALFKAPSAFLPITPYQFGAVGGGAEELAEWQAAVDYAITLDDGVGDQTNGGGCIAVSGGRFRFDDPLILKSETAIDFGKSELELYSAECGFDIGWDTTPRATDTKIENGRFMVRTIGGTGIRVQNAGGNIFRDLNIRLYETNNIGIHIRGNQSPTAPYYGVIDGVRIAGLAGKNHTGVMLDGWAGGTGSSGVNRWNMNFRHIVSCETGIDIVDAHGINFGPCNFEAIGDAAIRFNNRTVDYSGTVTTGGSTSTITDTSFPNTADQNIAIIKVLTGPNAGHTAKVYTTAANTINVFEAFPYKFTIGDTYELWKTKAKDIYFDQITLETAETMCDFKEGASNCKVIPSMRTQASGKYLFKRGHEDMTNTIARRYDAFLFTGSIVASQTTWLEPTFTTSLRGGNMLVESGWVDAVYVTGAVRAPTVAGLITIDTFAAGVDQTLPVLLTEDRPNSGRRVRSSLTTTQVIRPALDMIKVRAVADAALVGTEQLRVVVYVGY